MLEYVERLSKALRSIALRAMMPSSPISEEWGLDRGNAIDRFFIEAFLARHSADIRGRVLEVQSPRYTRLFGKSNVTKSDVLDLSPDNPQATIVADLTNAPHIEGEAFDCVIVTQTLQLIYDVSGAISTLHRMLSPNGVLLLTVPGITKKDQFYTWYWSFFPAAVHSLLLAHFAPEDIRVESLGNLRTSMAFLTGLAQEDLNSSDFIGVDANYPVIVTARAVKSRPHLQKQF
jgi:SAM-dependent methyltransferase